MFYYRFSPSSHVSTDKVGKDKRQNHTDVPVILQIILGLASK